MFNCTPRSLDKLPIVQANAVLTSLHLGSEKSIIYDVKVRIGIQFEVLRLWPLAEN